MAIEKLRITDKIFLLVFDDQLEITSTFLRFQEHYESPEFRGKIFTLDEFKKWYSSIKGSFTYYTDWNGFNIPSYVFEPFIKGKFDPLSSKEKELLDSFCEEKGKFYVIGVHKGTKNVSRLLKHEVAHGLFYTDPEYNQAVVKLLAGFDLTEVKKELASMGGYHDEVLEDESHAYALASKLKCGVPSGLKEQLEVIYTKYLEKNSAVLPEF